MKQPTYSKSHEKIVELLKENGRTDFAGGIQLFADQHDKDWSIDINFNSTGVHINRADVDERELEGDELIQICKTWSWAG